ncbi:unknown [Clostridium sp. CAG:169]|nr:unknown [Clostridium sp. CAG:169]
MNKTRGVLINFYTGFHQHLVVAAGYCVHIPFIRHMRGDDADIDAAFCCGVHRSHHLVAQNEVWGRDVYITFCLVDEVEVDRFSHRFVIQRVVCKRLDDALCILVPAVRVVSGVVLALFFNQVVPHRQEHGGQAEHRFSFQQDGGILPVSMLFIAVDIFIGKVDAAGKADVTVDDTDLAVVTGVKMAGQDWDEGVKNLALDPLFPQGLFISGRQGQDAAHIVIDDTDIHALLRLFLQHIQNGVPHGAFLNDEVFHEDITLGFL